MYLKNTKTQNFFIGKIFCYILILLSFFGFPLKEINFGFLWLSYYRIFIVLLLFQCVAYILLTKGRILLFQRKIRGYFIFLIIWFGYGIFSLLWVINKEAVIRNLLNYLLINILIIFLLTYHFCNKQDFQKLYLLYFSIYSGLLIFGFWEHITGYHLPMYMFYYDKYGLNKFIPTGIFFNINNYASFLLLYMPFAMGMLIYGKKLWIRLFSLIAIIGTIYLILIIGSRANVLGLIAQFLVFLLLSNFKKNMKLIAISAFCILILFLFFYEDMQKNLLQIEEYFHSIISQLKSKSFTLTSISVRKNLIKNGIYLLNSTKGFGIGAGNFEYYLGRYIPYYTAGIINPHNWWLELLVEFGVLIFSCYIILFLSVTRNLYKIFRRSQIKEEKMICEALLISLIGFIFACMSPSGFIEFTFPWYIIGFTFAFLNYSLKLKK